MDELNINEDLLFDSQGSPILEKIFTVLCKRFEMRSMVHEYRKRIQHIIQQKNETLREYMARFNKFDKELKCEISLQNGKYQTQAYSHMTTMELAEHLINGLEMIAKEYVTMRLSMVVGDLKLTTVYKHCESFIIKENLQKTMSTNKRISINVLQENRQLMERPTDGPMVRNIQGSSNNRMQRSNYNMNNNNSANSMKVWGNSNNNKRENNTRRKRYNVVCKFWSHPNMHCNIGNNCQFMHEFVHGESRLQQTNERHNGQMSVNMIQENNYKNQSVRKSEYETQTNNDVRITSNTIERDDDANAMMNKIQNIVQNNNYKYEKLPVIEETRNEDEIHHKLCTIIDGHRIWEKLTSKQRDLMQPFIDADPTIKDFYNTEEIENRIICTYKEGRLEEKEIHKRMNELKNDIPFQTLKKEIRNITKKYTNKNQTPFDNILTSKLDGSYKVLLDTQNMKKIYCMIDSGSGLNIANDAMGMRFKEFRKTRKRSFTVSVANNEEVVLRDYLELEINDPLNLNEHYRKIKTRFYIIANSPYGFIIGRSLMYKLGFMIVRDRDILSYIHRAKNVSDIIDIKSHYYQSIDYHIEHPMEIQETVNAIKSGELKMDVDSFDDKEARLLFEKTMMEFADVFSRNGEIGAHPTIMSIDLKENAVGFHDNLYPMSFKKEQIMIEEIQKLLENNIIEKCEPNEDLLYVSTAFLVSGGHKTYDNDGNSIKGSDRLVVNYTWVNLWTKRHPYMIPMVDDILKQLHGKKKFFLLDIKKGFYHMVLTKQASKLTAFRSPIGIFKWKRCQFGVINGPSNFQQRMDEGLADVCAVFIDDILGGAKEIKQYSKEKTTVEMVLVEKLITVLKRLKKMNVKLGIGKCSFNKKKIEFLGRIITEEGLALAPKHKTNIMNVKVPRNKNELASFMGLINILGSQVPHLADYVQEFTDIRKHRAPYVWTERHQSVFEALKNMMNKLPTLHHPDLTEKGGRFWVFNDSSGSAIGGVLMQERGEGLVPISFHSRILRENERNWHISEQEMQTMIENSNEWRKLLQPRLFIHVTDHENLLNLLNFASKLKYKNTRLQRQISQIADYEFICLFRPGKSMTIADYLSRCIDHDAHNGMLDELQVRRELNLKSKASETIIKEFEDKFNKNNFNNFVKRIPMSFSTEGKWKEIKNYEEFVEYENAETNKTINTIKIKDLIKNNITLKLMSDDNKNIRRKLTHDQRRRIACEKLKLSSGKLVNKIICTVKKLPHIPEYDDVQRYINEDQILNEILNMEKMNVPLILKHPKNDIIMNPLVRFAQTSNAHWLELIPKKVRADAIQGRYVLRNDGLLVTNDQRICIPRTLQASFVHYFHTSSFMQHQSLQRMILMMKERVFWPEMS